MVNENIKIILGSEDERKHNKYSVNYKPKSSFA